MKDAYLNFAAGHSLAHSLCVTGAGKASVAVKAMKSWLPTRRVRSMLLQRRAPSFVERLSFIGTIARLSTSSVPSDASLCELSLLEAAEGLSQGRFTSTDLTRACLARAHRIQDSLKLNAFVSIHDEQALRRAKESDVRRMHGKDLGMLDGIPVAFKDNFCTASVSAQKDSTDTGEPQTCTTTAGSRALEGYRSPFESMATSLLLQAGAVPIGKTTMDEFGMGSYTLNGAWGPTVNPWTLTRRGGYLPGDDRGETEKVGEGEWLVAGGSSGGSAVAVATGACFAALGSDTGGSVRQPAALCGVVGTCPVESHSVSHPK